MRILAIRGHNLASLDGPFALEFDRLPLDRAGLFAICGPTGAGKSTILDALSLALFDQMPRLPDGQGAMLGREGDPEHLQTRSTDVRAILRRGAASGWAEVDFEGLDGHAWRARWEVRRAGRKADGRLQPQTMTLSGRDDGQRLGDGKKSSVLAAIEARLGLTFDQFRRSVLLAQGDFASFLRARPPERSELLERITGTAIYSQVSTLAHQRAAAEQARLKEIEAVAEAFPVLTPDRRASLDDEARRQQATVREAEAEAVAARRDLDWHTLAARLTDQHREAATRRAESERAAAAAEPRRQAVAEVRQALPLRPALADLDRAGAEVADADAVATAAQAAARVAADAVAQAQVQASETQSAFAAAQAAREAADPALERATALDHRLATLTAERLQAETDHADTADRLQGLNRERDTLDRAIADATADLDARQRWLDTHAALAPLANQWERWDGALDRYGGARAALTAATADLERLAAVLADAERTRPALETARTEAETALVAADQALAGLRAEPVAALADLAARRKALEDRRDTLKALADLAEAAARLDRDGAAVAAELDEERGNADRETAASAQAQNDLATTTGLLGEAEAALERFRRALGKDVESLRAALVDGEPCPVCGAGDHPWAGQTPALDRAAGEQDTRVTALRDRQRELTKAHGRHEAAADAARHRIAGLESRRDNLASARRDLAGRWQAAVETESRWQAAVETESRWQAAVATEGGLPAAPGGGDLLAARLAGIVTDLDHLRREEQRAIDHGKRLERAAIKRQARADAHSRTLDALRDHREGLERRHHERTLALSARDRAEADRRAALAELDGPFQAFPGWQDDLRGDPAAFRADYGERAATYTANQEERSRRIAGREALARQRDAKAVACAAADQADIIARRRLDEVSADLAARTAERAPLLDGRPVAEVRRDLGDRLRLAEATRGEAARALNAATARLAAADQEGRSRAAEAEARRTKATRARATLAAALAAAGLAEDEARRRLRRDEAWLTAESEDLAALETARRDAAVLEGERARRLGDHRAQGEPGRTADAAGAALAAAQAARETAQARLAEAQAGLRADDEAQAKRTTVLAERTAQQEVCELWRTMDQLIGSASGAKLRNFAQSLSLDVLLSHANRHLEELARRYRLERAAGSDLEIQVIDRDMGDEIRSVYSLSGGETFLVSLALALGLSVMAGGGHRVGTLFIDEGFGSLDPDSLEVALSCLEALQASGRQVGIISHVPALVERIGVQVRVDVLGSGRSRVAVSGPAAAQPNDTTGGRVTVVSSGSATPA